MKFVNDISNSGIDLNGDLLVKHGKGKQIWPDGSEYLGFWKDDEIFGVGMYTYKNRDVYHGELQGGKAHGKGIL